MSDFIDERQIIHGLWSMVTEEGLKRPSGKVSGPKGPCAANGVGPPEGQGLRPEGSFYSQWRERPGGPVVRSQAPRAHLQPMERAQRGPSGKVSGPKGPCEPNGEGPEGPVVRS